MQNCSKCGAQLGKNAKYCQICFTPVSTGLSFTTLPNQAEKQAKLLEEASKANAAFLNPQKTQEKQQAVEKISTNNLPQILPNPLSNPNFLPVSPTFPNQAKFESQANFPNQPLFNKPSVNPLMNQQIQKTIQLTQNTQYLQPQPNHFLAPSSQPIGQSLQSPIEQTIQPSIGQIQNLKKQEQKIAKLMPKEPRVQQSPYLVQKNTTTQKQKPLQFDQDGFILVGSTPSEQLPVEKVIQLQNIQPSQNQSQPSHLYPFANRQSYPLAEPFRYQKYEHLLLKEKPSKIFLFSFQHIQNRTSHENALFEWVRKSLMLLDQADRITFQMEEADLFLCFESPPPSWLDALSEYHQTGCSLFVWYPQFSAQSTTHSEKKLEIENHYGEQGWQTLMKIFHFLYDLSFQNLQLSLSHQEKDDVAHIEFDSKWQSISWFEEKLQADQFEQRPLNLSIQKLKHWGTKSNLHLWFELLKELDHLGSLFEDPQNLPKSKIDTLISDIRKQESLRWIREYMLKQGFRTKMAVLYHAKISQELIKLLEDCQVEIKKAIHGSELLKMVSVDYFDWVLIDEQQQEISCAELIYELQRKCPQTKICLTKKYQQLPILDLPIHAQIDLNQPLIHTAIYLSKTLIQQQQQKSPYQQVLKYLEVLQLAQMQRQQSLDISLLLITMPFQITSILYDVIDRLRQQYLPKALQPQRLSSQMIAFVLSECPRESFDAFAQALEQKLQPMPTLILVNAQHPRHPHFLLADALLRLDLMEKAKQNIHYCHYDHLRFEKQMRQLPPLIDLQDHYAAHVFIIDRDLSAVHPLKRLFEEQSLIVNCFESSNQVRALMGQLTYLPQVVVINCDGHEDLVEEAMQLLSSIKQDHPGIKVMVSAMDMIEDKMEESFARGADDFLRKPFLMKEVLLRLMKSIT